jgi:hypothetical protein
VQDIFDAAWGYDFQPSNQAGWAERGVDAELHDVFRIPGEVDAVLGEMVSCTEVLEHLADPHGVVAELFEEAEVRAFVCSSPLNETGDYHDPCHAWAWDMPAYANMVEEAGWTIKYHEPVGFFQVIGAVK